MDRNNQNYKRIRLALVLNSADVVQICALGGMEISKDRATRWSRSVSAGPGRYSVMSDDEFDAFCAGLPEWAARNDE